MYRTSHRASDPTRPPGSRWSNSSTRARPKPCRRNSGLTSVSVRCTSHPLANVLVSFGLWWGEHCHIVKLDQMCLIVYIYIHMCVCDMCMSICESIYLSVFLYLCVNDRTSKSLNGVSRGSDYGLLRLCHLTFRMLSPRCQDRVDHLS